jgi:hypothetical protein
MGALVRHARTHARTHSLTALRKRRKCIGYFNAHHRPAAHITSLEWNVTPASSPEPVFLACASTATLNRLHCFLLWGSRSVNKTTFTSAYLQGPREQRVVPEVRCVYMSAAGKGAEDDERSNVVAR